MLLRDLRMETTMAKFNKKQWKRIKWLFRNLTPFQLIKYLVVKKPVFVYREPEQNIDLERYDIDNKIRINRNGTLLIKPSGMKSTDMIVKELKKNQVGVINAIEIQDYTLYADNVFTTAPDRERKIWAEILKSYFSDYCNKGVLLYLDKDIEEVAKIKNAIRKKVGISFFKVIDNEKSYISGITPIHSSNLKERILEESVIRSMIAEEKTIIRADLIDKEVLGDILN